jgi:hypothetical protein
MDELHVFGRNGPFASTPDPIKLYIFSAPLPAVSDNEKNAVAADPCRTFSHRMQAQTSPLARNATFRFGTAIQRQHPSPATTTQA